MNIYEKIDKITTFILFGTFERPETVCGFYFKLFVALIFFTMYTLTITLSPDIIIVALNDMGFELPFILMNPREASGLILATYILAFILLSVVLVNVIILSFFALVYGLVSMITHISSTIDGWVQKSPTLCQYVDCVKKPLIRDKCNRKIDYTDYNKEK